ncbi:MAG: apolipoprotein N-acyltransferase, partial [Bacteriovoracaceae bacterium]|nr:apolipoprotein N-acyltransferase [Bacteriovoracaceae bacterium]
PETAIYQPFNSNLLAAQPPINWPFIVDRTLLQTKTDLFTGGYDIYDLQQFNSAFYFTQPAAPQEGQPDTEQRTAHPINFAGRYHKMQLLAFGETLPFGIFNDLIYPYLGNLVSNFTPGKDYAVFTTANNITFVPNICYEILLSAWQRNYLQHLTLSPDLMINLTNDSWFGVTAEPEQHLFLGQWRAVEFQKAIVRSTNSGITTIIYPNGKTSERLEVNVRANLDQTIYIHPTAPTIYQRFGLGVVLALAGLLLIFIKIFSLPQKSNWQIKAKFKFKF